MHVFFLQTTLQVEDVAVAPLQASKSAAATQCLYCIVNRILQTHLTYLFINKSLQRQIYSEQLIRS